MAHCIIFEPDPACCKIVEDALASLHWSSARALFPEGIVACLPGPWAVMLAIESGDPAALDLLRRIREVAPDVVICALLDELSPHYDRQVAAAGANSVFAKPVSETEIMEALVKGFMLRRG